MNKQALLGIVRHVITTISGYFVAKGYLQEADCEVITGSIIALLTVVWSVYEKKHRRVIGPPIGG